MRCIQKYVVLKLLHWECHYWCRARTTHTSLDRPPPPVRISQPMCFRCHRVHRWVGIRPDMNLHLMCKCSSSGHAVRPWVLYLPGVKMSSSGPSPFENDLLTVLTCCAVLRSCTASECTLTSWCGSVITSTTFSCRTPRVGIVCRSSTVPCGPSVCRRCLGSRFQTQCWITAPYRRRQLLRHC